MNFSAILDISSFFIGMIINLLLIALICYYFKRKYENLEIAQNEQAKVLYQLLQQNSSPKVMNINDILKDYNRLNNGIQPYE
jgi:large-conductance mechanosensitive channel